VKSPSSAEILICERLKKFGYSEEREIRLYGQEIRLTSNPFPEGNGFAVEGIEYTSGRPRTMRIPLSLVETLRRELAVQEHSQIAA
jgi:hypothetical protein